MQQSIFDVIFPKFTFKKPIRLIEMFGGYGSQHLALKYLGVKVEHWKLVEWAVKSIQAYKDIHYTNVNVDYSKDLSKEDIIDYLSKLGISSNYNEPIPLKLRLKDMLEDNVSEKYYLSDKQLKDISNWNAYEKPLEHIDDEIVGTLTTRSGAYCAGMKLVSDYITIPEATKKGYAEATDGDGVYINRPHQKRGCVQKGKIQTLKTSCDDVGVVVNSNIKNINDEKGTFSTLGTNCGSSTSAGGGVVKQGLRIRKLSTRECFRLMGVKDEDYERIAKNQSNSSLYHLAGDSIVVNVLMTIFKELIK